MNDNKQKLKMILEDMLEDVINNNQVDEKFKRLYNDKHQLVSLFAFIHQETNRLFTEMNNRVNNKNYHFKAEDSRQLLKIINDINELQPLKEYGVNITLLNSYRVYLDRCREFLKDTNGSTIPTDLKPIDLKKHDTIFTLSEDSKELVEDIFNNKYLNEDDSITEISEATCRDIESSVNDNKIEWEGRLPNFKALTDKLEFGDNFWHYPQNDLIFRPLNRKRIIDDIGGVLAELETAQVLEFLCQTIHPAVRQDQDEVKKLYSIYNKHLKLDGYEIFETKEKNAGRPIFDFQSIKIEANLSLENTKKINRRQVKLKIDDCRKKIKQREYGNAISDAHVLLDACVGEIYKKKTGKDFSKNDNQKGFNHKFKELLLELNDESDCVFKNIANSLKDIVNKLLQIRNKYGEVHYKDVDANEYQAALVVNTTISLVDYLYGLVD